jgi:hypothetical protein
MRFVASILVLIGSQGLYAAAPAKTLYLDLTVAGEHQRSRMDAGVEAIDSSYAHSSIRIQEDENKVSKRGQFSISAFNASNTPSNFGTENITIAFGDGAPVAAISYDRLLKEEKNRQMWAAIATGLSAVGNSLSASQAGYSSGSASYSGTTYGRYGTSNSYGTASYSGYNGAAAYAAQADANAQNEAMFDRLASSNAANREALKANLRTNTIDPGTGFGGMVTFELTPEARKLKGPVAVHITVDFAGDKHEFLGQLVRR